ncbi:oxepin-CoA hydrolase, alternative type [Ideonella alba]|uniref:Enoyl-CoA hydratase/isomerase family protein n=1 Tax=Ideonella alba TaxID=2824118 RepID=A0A940YF06_9BURK|nr:enoyl-CoA hydratase family protein [Ideonella alba]MBQ0931265.1 enoyl-CoA hydratase/isomerase family protein [Ideonella alba]
MTATVLTQLVDRCSVITLSDPGSRNALSPTLYAALVEALDTAAANPEVRSVVLTGAGGHFCAGGHLQRLERARQGTRAQQAEAIDALHGLIDTLRALPKPVIAAVEGAAAGAGFSLALACDLMVAARDARFLLAYGRVGLTPDGGATWFLGRSVPAPLVREWVWLAEPIAAERLQQHGLVNRVCAPGSALSEALALAAQLARMAPNALAGAKALVAAAPENALRTHLEAEREAFLDQLFHDNAGEGIAAFLQRRAAAFH